VGLIESASAVVDEDGSAKVLAGFSGTGLVRCTPAMSRHSVASESCRPNTEIPIEKNETDIQSECLVFDFSSGSCRKPSPNHEFYDSYRLDA
jgi:hypothetical protein